MTQSMLPSIVLKAITLCSDPVARQLTIVQGCGAKGYPWKWWWMPLRVRLKNLGPLSLVPLKCVKQWYTEGKTMGGYWEGTSHTAALCFHVSLACNATV